MAVTSVTWRCSMTILQTTSTVEIGLKNVLLATDFSEIAERALRYAAALCRHCGSTLHLAHAIPEVNALVQAEALAPQVLESGYEMVCRQATERIETLSLALDGIPCQTHVRRGEVWDVLSNIVREEEVDLLVVGTHGRTGLGRLLLGSVAGEILCHSRCPVLTVGPHSYEMPSSGPHSAVPALEIKQIVLATDLSLESSAASRFAICLAEGFGSRLTLLHVIPHRGPQSEINKQAAIRELQALVPYDAELPLSPEFIVEFGTPAERILESSTERSADMIILGIHSDVNHLRKATHLSESIACKVIAGAYCPVLTSVSGVSQRLQACA